MKATLNDIAQKVGVSKSLVSMYLNNHRLSGRIAHETKKKIDDAVRELNYHPSFAACALSNGKTKTIGMICGGIKNPYFAYLVEDAMEEAVKGGYQLLLSLTRWIPEAEEKALENLLNRQIDGLLCCIEPDEGSRAYQLLSNASIPIMFINRKETNFYSICTDLGPVLDITMKQFSESGCSKVYGCFYRKSLWPETFRDSSRKYGLDAEILSENLDENGIREHLRNAQDGNRHGYVFNGYRMQTLMLRHFSEFPDYQPDVVVGVDDYSLLEESKYIIGGIYTDSPSLIHCTVNRLISLLENPGKPEQKHLLLKNNPVFLTREELFRHQKELREKTLRIPFPGW